MRSEGRAGIRQAKENGVASGSTDNIVSIRLKFITTERRNLKHER
jgi:hypothetical protein